MKKRRIAFAAIGVTAALVLAACGDDSGGGGSSAAPLDKVGAGEGALNIIAWAGYAEDSGNYIQGAGGNLNIELASASSHDVLAVSGADGKLRSVIQHQTDAATYAFAGSAPGVMEQLFADPTRPLLDQAVPTLLDDLEPDHITQGRVAGGPFTDREVWRLHVRNHHTQPILSQ